MAETVSRATGLQLPPGEDGNGLPDAVSREQQERRLNCIKSQVILLRQVKLNLYY
jgi:hypothetical protein